MLSFAREVLELVAEGTSFVLVTVLESTPPADVPAGTRLAVPPDQPPLGGIDRRLDSRIAATARELFTFEVPAAAEAGGELLESAAWRFEPPGLWKPRRRTLHLPPAAGGGQLELFLNPVLHGSTTSLSPRDGIVESEGSAASDVFRRLLDLEDGVLATVLAAPDETPLGSLGLYDPAGRPAGGGFDAPTGAPVSAAVGRVRAAQRSEILTTGGLELFLEPTSGAPRTDRDA